MSDYKDYVVRAIIGETIVDETLLTDVTVEVARNEREMMRASYPGCETFVYQVNADIQGGTVRVSNFRSVEEC